MRSILKNKKGDLPSIIIGGVVLIFVLGLTVIIFSKGFLAGLGELKERDDLLSNRSMDVIGIVEDKTIPLLDFAVFFSLIAVFIGLIVASIYVRVHPVLIVTFIIFLIIAIVLAAQFSNVFGEVIEKESIASTAENFTFTKLILTDTAGFALFPVIILVIGITVIVVFYGKSRSATVT